MLWKSQNVDDFNIKQSIKAPSVEQKPGKAKFVDGGVDEQRIRRNLDALHKLAQWAMDNKYDTISIS